MVENFGEQIVNPVQADEEGNLFIDPAAAESLVDILTPEARAEAEAPEEPLPAFDEKYHDDFEGLLYIGKLQTTVDWLGHKFTLRTMKMDEIIEAGQIHRPYVGTISDIKAWQSITIAASLVSVDGKKLPLPYHDGETSLQAKFEYINEHWYPWTVDKLYEECLILDGTVQEVIDRAGKAYGAERSTPGSNTSSD